MAAKYAQHFLINTHAADRIVEALRLTREETVLEIGPGKGALTGLLLDKARHVVAIEIDPEMAETLQKKFTSKANFTVVQQDFLDADLGAGMFGRSDSGSVGAKSGHPCTVKLIGNLPYNLTSPILRKICSWDGWSEAVLMVQKEVGDRLVAKVNTPDYGALTVGMSLSCTMERVFDLSETSFKPPPRVKSTVVRLARREKPLTNDIVKTQRVIQAAFQQRRKTIINSLSHGLNLEKVLVQTWLSKLGLDANLRAENLTVDHFLQITQCLS